MEREDKHGRKILKRILLTLLAIIIVFVLIILRKFIILNKISNLSDEDSYNNNYYVEKHSYQWENLMITQSYNKDAKFLTTVQVYGKDIEGRKITFYSDGMGQQTALLDAGEDKIALLDGNVVGGRIGIFSFINKDLGIFNRLVLSVISRITTEECNRKECYLIEPSQGWKIWIDKKTGLTVREINGDIIADHIYEFNNVKDEDIVKPDMTGYKIPEND